MIMILSGIHAINPFHDYAHSQGRHLAKLVQGRHFAKLAAICLNWQQPSRDCHSHYRAFAMTEAWQAPGS